jgi:hypothetical protein
MSIDIRVLEYFFQEQLQFYKKPKSVLRTYKYYIIIVIY